jgi:diguanylate cyclase (GGDEF)-like protein
MAAPAQIGRFRGPFYGDRLPRSQAVNFPFWGVVKGLGRVPVEILVGVLIVSVLGNGALLLWLARADHVTIHWPNSRDSGRSNWPDFQTRDPASGRRRALFIAGQSQPGASARPGIQISPNGGGPAGTGLPPDLAELLARPAPLGPREPGQASGHQRDGGNGFHTSAPDGVLVRVQPPSASAPDTGIPLDALTGLEGPQGWSRIIEVENARLLRYRRPSTVVVAEVDGLRRLAERLGEEPVSRLLPVVADALRSEARGSDWVARIGYGRFAAFLAETDEIAAINYVERIRQLCEPWLSSSAVPLRLAIGWSSPNGASDMEFAIKRAEERMHSDRRVPPKLPAPKGVASGVVALPEGDAGDERGQEVVSPAEPGRPVETEIETVETAVSSGQYATD